MAAAGLAAADPSALAGDDIAGLIAGLPDRRSLRPPPTSPAVAEGTAAGEGLDEPVLPKLDRLRLPTPDPAAPPPAELLLDLAPNDPTKDARPLNEDGGGLAVVAPVPLDAPDAGDPAFAPRNFRLILTAENFLGGCWATAVADAGTGEEWAVVEGETVASREPAAEAGVGAAAAASDGLPSD